MKPLFYVCLALLLTVIVAAQSSRDSEEFEFVRRQILQSKPYVPKGGYVPDAETAKGIAYAIAVPVYGKRQVDAEKPLRAELYQDRWTVIGTPEKKTTSGGTLIVQIDRTTGKVLYLNHSM